MIYHKANNDEWLLVQIRPDLLDKELSIRNGYLYFGGQSIRITLPPGTWQIIGKASELLGSQVKEIVEQVRYKLIDRLYYETSYKRYGKYSAGAASVYEKAIESFQSLLASHDLKASETLILKREK